MLLKQSITTMRKFNELITSEVNLLSCIRTNAFMNVDDFMYVLYFSDILNMASDYSLKINNDTLMRLISDSSSALRLMSITSQYNYKNYIDPVIDNNTYMKIDNNTLMSFISGGNEFLFTIKYE